MATGKPLGVFVLAVAILLCAFSVGAATDQLPRIGVLWPGDVQLWNNAFLEGLRQNGYIDGTTAIIDVRGTGSNFESGFKHAEQIVLLRPDVIFAAPGALAKFAIRAVNNSRKSIPIVVLTWDPVAEGVVDSAAHPGRNVTGVAGVWHSPEFVTKHLQLVKDLIPQLTRVAYILDTVWYRKEQLVKTRDVVEKGGKTMGVLVTSMEVQKADQLEHVFAQAVRNKASAVIVSASPMFAANRGLIIGLAAKYRLPAVYGDELFAYDGGLMSYGTGIVDMHKRAADKVAKILHGAKPADIPVDYPTRLRLTINLRTAKALGLTISESVLLQADEVIK